MLSASFVSMAMVAAGHLVKARNDLRRGQDVQDMRMGQLVSYLIVFNLYITEVEEPKLKGLTAGLWGYNFLMASRAPAGTAAYLKYLDAKGGGSGKAKRDLLKRVLLQFGTALVADAATNSGTLPGAILGSLIKFKSNGLPAFTESKIVGMVSPVFPGSATSITFLRGVHSLDVQAAMASSQIWPSILPGSTSLYSWHHHEVMGIMMWVLNPWHVASHIGGRDFYQLSTGTEYK